MFKIKELVPVKEPNKPSDTYELVLDFSAKNHDDTTESFFFDSVDELFKGLTLLLEYFEVNYNSRCGNSLFAVLSEARKEEVLVIENKDYDDRTEYEEFCNFLNEEWPHDSNWMPRMLDSFEVYYYSVDGSKFKVVLDEFN